MRNVTLLLVSVLSVFAAVAAKAQTPLTTAFTYQGELASGGTPATGTYDIRYRLYDAATGGTPIGGILCSDNLAVTGGRFAASLDFGAAFAGQKRFLEIEVRPDTGLDCGDAAGYTVLSPRQELTATPNATFAQTATTATTAANAASLNGQSPSFYQNAANLTGTLADARLPSNVARLNSNQTFTGLLNFTNAGNTFAGSGAGLTNLNGASINAGTLARSSLSADVQSGVGTVIPELSLAGTVPTGSRPTSVAVSGSFAYVVNQTLSTLQVLNISNPAAPTLAGSVATGDGPFSVAVSGSFAYVVNLNSDTLQVFNISSPAAPTLAGSIATGSFPVSVAVSGSFAYVVNNSSNTLQVFNISSPAAPTLAGSVATGDGPFSVAVSGSFAYVVNFSSNTLQVFNISNPAAPTLAGSIATGGQPRSVAVSGSFAYVVNGNSDTLQVFNISSPSAPTLAGSIATGGQPRSVTVSGSFAYVVNYNSNTLQVFNISNPAAPTLTDGASTDFGPYSVAVSGSFAYVVSEVANTLQVFNTRVVGFGTRLAASSLAGVNGSGLTGVNATQFNGQTASFYTNASNITTGTLADAQLSGNIARLNSNQTFTGLLNLTNAGNTFAGNGAGLTNLSGGSITAGTLARSSLSADVQRGAGTLVPELSLAGGIATGSRPGSVAVSGSFAYVANLDSNTLQVFNISSPAAITLAGSVATGNQPRFVAVSGSYAYVVNGDSNTLQVFNISSPAAPTLAGSIATGSFPTSVAVSGSFAYVVNGFSNTLQLFNISNPAVITLAGSVATGFQPVSVALSGSFAYVASINSNALQVFRTFGVGFGTPLAASSLAGVNGSGLTGVNAAQLNGQTSSFYTDASNITTGTLAAAQIPNLDASKITSGTLADARLSSNIALKNAANAFTATGVTSFAGNLGIGTTTPSTQFALEAVSGTDTQIALTSGPATGGAIPRRTWSIQSSNVTLPQTQITGSFQIVDRTAGASRMLIDTNGNVGIGTTSPSQRLTVAGNAAVLGSLSKGGGSFKIDHPLDPENKYLYHSFVESPDMMNVYNGEVTTDGTGYAVITLPDYFQALNRDFRYQLTVIDDDDRSDVVVWAKVVRRIGVDGANTFAIRTFRPNVAVSWQVTGIRRDAWAEKNRIPNAVEKSAAEKGKLLHPEAFGKPAEEGIMPSDPAKTSDDADQPANASK